MRRAAAALHAGTGRSAGNGSPMPAGVVAPPYLDDPAATAEAARLVSGPTHVDDLVAAVRAGDDTDTVAAIAGALLGARTAPRPYPPGGGRPCTAGRG